MGSNHCEAGWTTAVSSRNGEDLDRKGLYLNTLFETSRELAGLIQPTRILDTFLLMTMGPLGIMEGLGALINLKTREGDIACRGFKEEATTEFKDNIPQICERYFAGAGPEGLTVPEAMLLNSDDDEARSLFPATIRILIRWSLNQDYAVLLGLGNRLSGDSFNEADLGFIMNLANTLAGALGHALYTKYVQQLNADLNSQTDKLVEALDQAQRVQRDLDKKVFHLKSLYEMTTELSPIMQSGALMENFLLMTMGSLGIGQGFVLLYDRAVQSLHRACRGFHEPRDLQPQEAEKLLFESFEVSIERKLSPLSVSHIAEPRTIFEKYGLGAAAECGLLFVIDQKLMGLVGLGPAFSGAPALDEALLQTQVHNLMVFLRNARSYEVIQNLNADLAQRNEELTRTIQDLTEARHKITMLERAKARIKSLVEQETQRIGRASFFDTALIIVAASLIGLLFNFFNPDGVRVFPESLFRDSAATVQAMEAKALVENGTVVLVDARPEAFYNERHIKGAINVPASLFDVVYMMKLAELDLETPIIVYGRNISKHYDEEVADLLKQRDHENVRVLAGGLSTWKKKGYSTEP